MSFLFHSISVQFLLVGSIPFHLIPLHCLHSEIRSILCQSTPLISLELISFHVISCHFVPLDSIPVNQSKHPYRHTKSSKLFLKTTFHFFTHRPMSLPDSLYTIFEQGTSEQFRSFVTKIPTPRRLTSSDVPFRRRPRLRVPALPRAHPTLLRLPKHLHVRPNPACQAPERSQISECNRQKQHSLPNSH
jgi:hypothetical protein